MFEEKQQARKARRDLAGNVSNGLFLTSITGHRKEAVQNDINERLPKNDS